MGHQHVNPSNTTVCLKISGNTTARYNLWRPEIKHCWLGKPAHQMRSDTGLCRFDHHW